VKRTRGKRIKKEVAEGILEQSTIETRREEITERNRQLRIYRVIQEESA